VNDCESRRSARHATNGAMSSRDLLQSSAAPHPALNLTPSLTSNQARQPAACETWGRAIFPGARADPQHACTPAIYFNPFVACTGKYMFATQMIVVRYRNPHINCRQICVHNTLLLTYIVSRQSNNFLSFWGFPKSFANGWQFLVKILRACLAYLC